MPKSSHRRLAAAGLPPGSVVHVGVERTAAVGITAMCYDADGVRESRPAGPDQCPATAPRGVTWINVDGVHDTALIERIGRRFDLHPLVMEDIVNTTQRPKIETYDGALFVVTKMLTWDAAAARVHCEHVSFVLLGGCLLSFQEVSGDVFDTIRQRIRSGKGRIRAAGADYLLYALLDALVDYYFVVLEAIGDQIEDLQDMQTAGPAPDTPRRIGHLKRQMVTLRRAIWPMREAMGALTRDEQALIEADTRVYLRDLYDHTIQVIETAETYRDGLSGTLDIYLSSVSNRMNEVMKVLTIIATIFIPLTFIAGIYGMNFERMPELKWYYGYPAAMAVMLVIAVLMLVYFRRKRWL